MHREEHAAGMVCDAVMWVSGDVVEDLVDGCQGEFGGRSLLGKNGTQGHDKLVVYVPCMIY